MSLTIMVAMLDKRTIRRRALALIAEDGRGVGGRLAAEFGLSRQAANAHLQALVRDRQAEAEGSTRAKVYRLTTLREAARIYARPDLSEDVVWAEVFAPIVADLPENVRDIWHSGVTEMVNNAIDHSGSEQVLVTVHRNALHTDGMVIDRGEGIFLKIQRALGLYDPREAILELAKGKLTTDPENHTGEGIFFTSKIFDEFGIASGPLHYAHVRGTFGIIAGQPENRPGSAVLMRLDNDSPRTLKEVFDEYAAPEEYTFSKTLVPVRLAQYEGEKLLSRSQAKRLYQRFERFSNVVLDFEGVAEIGQAFADELFRVFAAHHPSVILAPINLSEAVSQMVRRVKAAS
jgi:hypothetical protein